MGLIFMFAVSFAIGILLCNFIVIPLVYNLPKAIKLFNEGNLKFISVPYQLIKPAICSIILYFVYIRLSHSVIFTHIRPHIKNPIYITFIIGIIFGNLVIIHEKLITRRGRSNLRSDFYYSVFQKFKSNNSATCDR